jgi:hypothetical protein
MAKRHTKSKNEKVAEQLSTILNDLTLDLDQIGEYISRSAPNVSYRRLVEVAEAARYDREEKDHGTDYLW